MLASALLPSFSTGLVSGPALPATPTLAARLPGVQMTSQAELEKLAKEQNPVVGYYDPLNLAKLNFWGQGDEATIGFLRHAEIKHGRVAMAAFVGFCVQSTGFKLPGEPFASITSTSPPDQWDALPLGAKYQIILFIGFLEVFSEHSFILEKEGQKHYMKGGKPGYFPTFDTMVHPVPFNLYDPLNFYGSKSAEYKAQKLNVEVNNGRLAMIGIMGFLAAAKVPGSVPALSGLIQPYSGDVMAPFGANFHLAAPGFPDNFSPLNIWYN